MQNVVDRPCCHGNEIWPKVRRSSRLPACISFFPSPIISEVVARSIVTGFCHTCSVATRFYKIRSEIWEAASLPRKIWRPKFGVDFGQLRSVIANIPGMKQDIVERKTTLQTAISPAHTSLIWWTLVHKRRKIGPEFRLTQRIRVAWVTFRSVRTSLRLSPPEITKNRLT